MARIPGGQTREVMQRKREQVERLLGQGLSVFQVSRQVNCSKVFVRQVRTQLLEKRQAS